MKKIVLIFVILFTMMFAGVLYGTHQQVMQESISLSLDQVYNNQYPATMPDVVIDPMVTVALY